MTIAAFRQTTSRADDPQLHTHAVISGKVQTLDGRWLALDARFLKRHQRKLGGLYQSVLRNELTHRFGVDWEPIINGQAEIADFPEELIETFSKRAAEVEETVKVKVEEFRRRQARQPTSWERAALTQEAAADTRGRKTGSGAVELRPEWLAEAAWQGWSPGVLVEQITTAGRDQTAATVDVTVGALRYPLPDAVAVCGPALEPSLIDGLEIQLLDTADPMEVTEAGTIALTITLTNTGDQPIHFDSGHPSTEITDAHGQARTLDTRAVDDVGIAIALKPGASQDFDLNVSLASCDPAVGYLVPPGDHFLVVSFYNGQLQSTMNSEPLSITIAG